MSVIGLLFLALAHLPSQAAVQAPAAQPASLTSPAGLWTTTDDKTGKVRGRVRVYEQGGRYFARIEAALQGEDPAARCTVCKDDRKDQLYIGLVIMRNMQLKDGEYSGGDILDPDTGKVYRCKFKLDAGGTRLIVRGYIGISLFGRSQTWQRTPG